MEQIQQIHVRFCYAMNMLIDELTSWIGIELERRDWSYSELARRADLSQSMVSKVMAGHANPGIDFLIGMARAFGVSREFIFRKAGLLQPEDIEDEDLTLISLMNEWRQLSDEDRLATYHMARSLNQARRQKREVKKNIPTLTNEPLRP